jgi:hypothetical protein
MGQLVPDELITQTGFAHAGLANDPHHLAPSFLHMGRQGMQGRQFTGAPDERRQHACPLEAQEAPWRASPQDGVDCVQRGLPGHGRWLHRGHLRHLVHQARRCPTAPNGPRGGLGLQSTALGQRVSYYCARTLWRRLEQAHRHLPRVEPQAHLQPRARLSAESAPGLADLPLQRQSCQHGALRMLFLGQRRPKDGQDLFTG